MRVFQIGAAGGVGRRLAALLAARGHDVTGMHRGAEQGTVISAAGALPVKGNLVEDSVEQIAELMAGHDAVVFSAGAHGTGMDQTSLIDGEGLVKSAAAARLAGVGRFVLISVFPDAGRSGVTTEGFEHYMRVKKSADVHLAGTDLDWMIVRPGTLLDGPGDGRVTAGFAVEYGDVRRDNVAAFIAAALDEPVLGRRILELTDGDVPVVDALRGATSC